MQRLMTAIVLTLTAAAGPGLAASAAAAASDAPGGPAGTSTPGGAAQAAPLPVSGPSAVAGAKLWVQTYNGTGNSGDAASSVAVSPGGGTVFVTGSSTGTTSGPDYATVAYDAATGARLWVRRYNGPGNSWDAASSVAVSPGGGTVFVTGDSMGTTSGSDYATIAYNAATGARLWVSRYNGPGNGSDDASKVAVSPDGSTVFVTGSSTGTTSGVDYATIAYNAATGARLWVSRYNGHGNGSDAAYSLAVSPDGSAVFVTGQGDVSGSAGFDYVTVGYKAATGGRMWVKPYDGATGTGVVEAASSVAVSPGGGRVFVTGESGNAYATVAYKTTGGSQLWASRYSGNSVGNQAYSLAVSPDGSGVFVTGQSGSDYATIRYNTASGAALWVKRYAGATDTSNVARSVAISPDGSTVYVTGTSFGITTADASPTIAYAAVSGSRLWKDYYFGPNGSGDASYSVAVSPTTGTVFVTGYADDPGSGRDYATVAYSG